MVNRAFSLGFRVATALALLSCLVSGQCVQATGKKVEWIVEQRHHANGNHIITLTSDAVKIQNKNYGYKLLSRAPQWDIYAYRDDDKVMFKLSRKAYFGEQGFDPQRPKVNTNPIVANEDVCRIKTRVFRGPHHDDYVAEFKGISHEVDDLITAAYKFQEVDGIVLKSVKAVKKRVNKSELLSQYVDEQTTGTRLETLSAKAVPYKAADFEIPANLKKASNLRAVTTSVSRRKDADIFIEQMGLGEKLGNSKHK